ncbi:MAG: amidohydrolase [Geodermatophilaceae bacterium]|nr:amidohydrolase [Geodermatophilaceae bacterium]
MTRAYDDILQQAGDLAERTIDFRRRLHRRPEIGLQLPKTQEAILAEIGDLGLEVRTGTSTTSVTAVLEGTSDGPTVLLRGDMDALPLTENTGLAFTSEVDGVMHACGHDTHVAMLAGAARLLADRRAEIAGRVVFMFQPGEEGFHGARHMLDEGLLDTTGQRPTGAFALHITSMFGSGTINTRPGPLLASADTIRMTVQGKGGHASAPHYANDPIPVACEIVIALQTMVTRRIDIFDPAVVTIAHVTAGTTDNVIPATASLEGTIRALSAETRGRVHELLRQVAQGIGSAHGMQVEVDIEAGYPVTVNDDDFASSVHALAGQMLGADRSCVMDTPIMGAEDWSYVLQEVPGAMAFLGACPPDLEPDTAPGNHSNLVVFDEAALSTGVATYAAVALDTLAR